MPIKPYYKNELTTIYNGDCLEVMDYLIEQDVKVDAIITDPPYIFNSGGNGGGGMLSNRNSHKEIHTNLGGTNLDIGISNEYFTKIKRLFNKKMFNVIMFCNKSQLYKYIEFAEKNKYLYNILIWHKTNPIPTCHNKYLDDIEFIFQMKEKGGKKILGDYSTKSKVYQSLVNKKDKKLYNHPTIKPLELIKKFITNHTDENDLILDTYSGSFTTSVACEEMQRRSIGIELEKKYCDIGIKRLNSLQLKFDI